MSPSTDDITKAFFRRLFCCRAVEERRKRSYTTLLASRKKSLQEYFDNELLEIEKKGIETSHNIRRSVRKDMSIEYNARAKAFNLVVEKSIADEVEITAQSIKSTKEQPLLFTEFINAQSTQVDSIINI